MVDTVDTVDTVAGEQAIVPCPVSGRPRTPRTTAPRRMREARHEAIVTERRGVVSLRRLR
jgi:hypothetical protein